MGFILPKLIEKYISIEIGHLRFLDSNSFLQSSLEKNVSCLPKESFIHLNSQLSDDPLFKKKLAYPYELCTTLEDYYRSITELSKENFWSTLNQGYPSDGDIERTHEMIKKYSLSNMQQLPSLYLKMDVLHLADVFETFVHTAFKDHGINPLYSYSMPGFSWQAMLYYTKRKLTAEQCTRKMQVRFSYVPYFCYEYACS